MTLQIKKNMSSYCTLLDTDARVKEAVFSSDKSVLVPALSY